MDVSQSLPATSPPQGQTVKTPVHQHVYEQMRALILFGDLAPAQAVTIQGLTSTLSVGITPVREALRRLIAEGALIGWIVLCAVLLCEIFSAFS